MSVCSLLVPFFGEVSDMGITLVCENLSELRVFRLYAMAQLNPSAFIGLQRWVTSHLKKALENMTFQNFLILNPFLYILL